MSLYYIQQGVRRCVAARDAGNSDIPAILFEPGQPPVQMQVSLHQLYSPKRFVLRDARYIRDIEYPTRVLQTVPPPIEIEPLGAPRQTSSIPLAQVRLV